MQVLMVSTSYPRNNDDWRGIFIRRIVEALARTKGTNLRLWAPPGEIPEAVESATDGLESEWLRELMLAGGISHLMRRGGFSRLGSPIKLLQLLRRAYRRERVDVYHINWLQCALPLPDNGVPALISVLGNDLKLLRLPLMRTALRRAMRRRRVALCPNAEWMSEQLGALFGDLAEVLPVAFGVDARWFAIERDARLKPARWIAVTRLTAAKLGHLIEWGTALFTDTSRELHVFGPMQERIDLPTWVQYHGPATACELARDWFPLATGLISLSWHAEGRPQVMLEAMASGLPIVASRQPAHASLIDDERSGILCDTEADFARALTLLEDPATNARFGACARQYASDEFGSWEDCALRYLAIYERLCGGRVVDA